MAPNDAATRAGQKPKTMTPRRRILASGALGCGGNTHTRRNQCVYYGGLRVRPNILRCARVPYNSAQHEPDHCENDETNVAAGEVLIVLGESAATPHPTVAALNDPSLGQHVEALGGVRALDDLERDAGHFLHLISRRLALVAAVGDCLFE